MTDVATILCRWEPMYAGYLVVGYATVLAGNLVLSDHEFIDGGR